MKIAILLQNAGRGSGEVARQHAQELVHLGNEVLFLHPSMGEGALGATNLNVELHSAVIPVHEFLPSAGPNQKQTAQMDYTEAIAYVQDFESTLEEIAGDVDLFLGHHANISSIAVSTVAQKHSRPYVLFLHGTGIEPRHEGLYDDRIWAAIEDAIQQADGILVTTEYVRDELVLPIVNIPMENFLILPCGIDLQEFRPDADPRIIQKYKLPEKYVICPGALTRAKGPQNVVEASHEYADLAPTIFIGDGELKNELEKEIGDRGDFLGFVSSEDKAALIRSATILAAGPEKKEHFGIIYAEALAAGTPPVAYEGGGVGSIISPESGILVDRSPKLLGNRIRYLLEADDERLEMQKKARKRAEKLFSKELLGEQLNVWLKGIQLAY